MEILETDIDKQRSPHEPQHHWELKKRFMMAHRDKFNIRDLACLAQTLGNIEFMGCAYPHETMKKVSELSRGIVEEFRERKKGKLQRTFVSGSAAANSKVNKTSNKRPGSKDASSELPLKQSKYANFVSSSSNDDNSKVTEGFILPPKKPTAKSMKFYNDGFANSNNSSTSHLPNLPSLGEDYDNQAVFKPNYQLHFEEQKRLHEDNPPSQVHLHLNYDYPLHNFIVVRLEYLPNETPCEILNRSAGFCKMPTVWEYKGNNICFIKVDGTVVCEDTGENKQDARDRAAAKALKILQKNCYTIKVKNRYLSDGTEVDLMDVEVNTTVGGKSQALGSSNIGHKLLSMMGWAGGGLGKSGSGVSEPITATTVFGREGLGNRDVGKNFKLKITKIIEEWMNSNSPYDLVFTTGFDNNQRKEMHQIARRFGLKSKSFGKNEDRHLTITKKFDGVNLVEELVRRGGETEKYCLLPPGSL